jgi:hypothetical protein
MTGNPFDFTGLRSGPAAAELQRDGARVFIAAVSAFAALASAFLYLHFGRKSELAAAGKKHSISPKPGTRSSLI